MNERPDVITLPDPAAVAHQAAQIFASSATEAIDSRGRFSVVLPGGSTPAMLFRILGKEPQQGRVPWANVHLFWGDERCVPPTDPASNYHLASQIFISSLPIPPDNIHRIPGELGATGAARAYERDLLDYFCGPHPRFDLVVLGLGVDGHTASLFPGSAALEERERLAMAVTASYQDRPSERVTMTPRAINSARHVLFLVTGSAKASIVRDVLQGSDGRFPARLIQPSAGQLTWLLDAEAASQLG